MVSEAIRTALLSEIAPYGDTAGSAVLQLAEDRGMDAGEVRDVYSTAIHYAALADILVSAIRKPTDQPWLIPDHSVQNWTSSCLMSPDGNTLRRVIIASHWTDERQAAECRNWFTQGEVCHYNLPMQLVVLVVGQTRVAKKRGPWTQGFLHPQNHQLRFRRRKGGFRSEGNTFNDKWVQVWREDRGEITRETWLEAMLVDDVLPEVCFKVDVPVPEELHRQRIVDTAARQLDALDKLKQKPPVQLSSCDWPVPCVFKRLCHQLPEREPSEKQGFVFLGPR